MDNNEKLMGDLMLQQNRHDNVKRTISPNQLLSKAIQQYVNKTTSSRNLR